MHETTPYDAIFFETIDDTVIQSARVIVPLVSSLLQPKSIVDIGGGTGSWASIFLEQGTNDVVCVDGPYVERSDLRVPVSQFVEADISKPLDLHRRFDLAICLEVAEHLPEAAADVLIDSVSGHSNAVLFSAAIPHQGGTQHVNLQWPAYWAAKFRQRGYRCFDCIRPAVWNDDAVAGWYKQNTLLYVNDVAFAGLASDSPVHKSEVEIPPAVVHPDIYLSVVGDAIRTPRVGDAFRTLVHSTTQSIRHRTGQVVQLD